MTADWGWHYPPGAEFDPRAPWNEDEREWCELCGKESDRDCRCEPCAVCGDIGNPACIDAHDLDAVVRERTCTCPDQWCPDHGRDPDYERDRYRDERDRDLDERDLAKEWGGME